MPDNDLPSTPPGSSEPSEDWEARFKGLQRKYHQLESEKNALATSLEAARTTSNTLQQRISALEGEKGSIAAQYEARLSELTAQTVALTTEKTQLGTQITELQGKVVSAEKDREVRKVLAHPKYQALVPFYESGHLSEIQNLQGDQLTEKLDSFNALLGDRAQNAMRQMMTGTVPPPAPGPTFTAGDHMSADDLAAWINNPANHTSPQFDDMQERYFNAVSKSRTRDL